MNNSNSIIMYNSNNSNNFVLPGALHFTDSSPVASWANLVTVSTLALLCLASPVFLPPKRMLSLEKWPIAAGKLPVFGFGYL